MATGDRTPSRSFDLDATFVHSATTPLDRIGCVLLDQRRGSKRGRNGSYTPPSGINTTAAAAAEFCSATASFGSPIIRSSLLTVPPGISPAVLHDSQIRALNALESNAYRDNQTHESEKLLMDFELPDDVPKQPLAMKYLDIGSNIFDTIALLNSKYCDDDDDDDNLQITVNNLEESTKPEHVGTENHTFEDEQRGSVIRVVSEDGYNWRKYGQKHVKGSEFPRSYYKCTHLNCQVKKKVERSLDGQITEIVYKGVHNHEKSDNPDRRATIESVIDLDENLDHMGGVADGLAWRNSQCRILDWSVDGLERTSSTSIVTELSDPLSNSQGKAFGVFESVETPELSSTLVSNGDDDDAHNPQGSVSISDEFNDGELESKRRKNEGCLLLETNLASRSVREPRVIVQIESEIDVLHDGYRWRKYGQKVVKGNPNPRSYYKCTSIGCSVRKHVERASSNLKCVITTYEGRHNHEVPGVRNNNNTVNSTNGVHQSQPITDSSRNTSVPKSEPQIQDLATHFVQKTEFNNEHQHQGLSYNGTYRNDMKVKEGPSNCQMKFPPFQSTLPYSSLTSLFGSMASKASDFPISLPLNQNISSTNFGFGNERSMQPFQAFIAEQKVRESDRYHMPKQQLNDNNLCSFSPNVDNTILSSSSSMYHRVIQNFR